jgi:cytochrome c oxidase subunit 4
LCLYLAAWLALLAALAGSVVSAYLPLGPAGAWLPLAFGLLQVAVIAGVFMRLGEGVTVKWLFAGAGFYWLLILIGLSGTDYLTRTRVTSAGTRPAPPAFSQDNR